MFGKLAVLLLCVQGGVALVPQQQSSLLQTWNKALDGSTGAVQANPVTKVLNLLKEMQTTLDKDMDEDANLYEKLTCWCNTNKYEKGASIDAATSKISELESKIESSAARSAELQENIKAVKAEVVADKATLAEATAQREKEAKAFDSMEKESTANIGNLANAINMLKKHAGSALLAIGSHGRDEDVADVFSDEAQSSKSQFLQKEPAAAVGWSASDAAVVRGAVTSASAFLQQNRGETVYDPQSGEIYGVVQQLKENMQASLSAAQKAENKAIANFKELSSAKTAEIENGEATEERKEDELAETNNILAEAKEDLGQTTTILEADQKFLANVVSTCATADSDFEKRKASRLDEIKAVGETIGILTSDDARDLMFIQTASSRVDARRKRAAAVLRRVSSLDLSLLASTVERDSFTKVKESIDIMITQLKKQQADELTKADWCAAEFQSNEMSTMKAKSLKGDQDTKLADTAATLQKLTEEAAQAKKDIVQLQAQLKRASENREQETADFHKTVAEQAATQAVLKTALDRLAKFYGSSLAQVHTQKTYKKNSGAGGVMAMLETLVDDAKRLQASAGKAEQDSQAQYATLVADNNASVKALEKAIVTKSSEKAEATQDKGSTESDLSDNQGIIAGLAKTNANLHNDCDWLQNNLSARQEGQQQEVESLQQAKSILSGASR